MRYLIGRLWLGLFRWRLVGVSEFPRKFVFIAAPHTSNWDLPHMIASAWVLRIRISWLGKEALFRTPLFGHLMTALGGISIDRSAPNRTVSKIAERFRDAEDLVLAVPAEGTRGKTEYWKSGFYRIAEEAGIPIGLGYLDYGRHVCGVGELIRPTGDLGADMDRIRAFYAGIRGRHPEFQGTPRLRDEVAHSERSAGLNQPSFK